MHECDIIIEGLFVTFQWVPPPTPQISDACAVLVTTIMQNYCQLPKHLCFFPLLLFVSHTQTCSFEIKKKGCL